MDHKNSNLAHGTIGSPQLSIENSEAEKQSEKNDEINNTISENDILNSNKNISIRKNNIQLPQDRSQIDHIFRKSEGHLQNTVENQKILVDLANDKSKYIGTDIYGNNWNVNYNNSGEQIWVRYRNNVINEGGINKIPRK